MKKSTAIAFILLLALSLAACGSKEQSDGSSVDVPTPEPSVETGAVVAEVSSYLSILQLTGTVNIKRGENVLDARAGMRLMNLDLLRTLAESSAWLLLEEDRAVELGELTTLHIDKQARGFVLTLTEGEIKAQIDSPLNSDEEFTVFAGTLALSVRGTVFTARIDSNTVTVNVEYGEVAVIDAMGEEIATVKAGESMSFETDKLVEFGGYSWRVLAVSSGKALLLAEHILEYGVYNEVRSGDVTWETCTLRAYLNGDFLNSFNSDDRAKISETQVINNDNESYQGRTIPGGADTTDRIFLLSMEEAETYFGEESERIAYDLDDGEASKWWWLRTPGDNSSSASNVTEEGLIGTGGWGVTTEGGIRPALWLKLGQ
jgi:hypothetical protein